jgi:hypothetical protein
MKDLINEVIKISKSIKSYRIMKEWTFMRKEEAVASINQHLSICLDGVSDITQNLTYDSPSVG